jgi:hypothetical protein
MCELIRQALGYIELGRNNEQVSSIRHVRGEISAQVSEEGGAREGFNTILDDSED